MMINSGMMKPGIIRDFGSRIIGSNPIAVKLPEPKIIYTCDGSEVKLYSLNKKNRCPVCKRPRYRCDGYEQALQKIKDMK